MKRRGLQIPPGLRRLFYLVCLVLFITGAVWAWVQHRDQSGDASEAARNLKVWATRLHGYAALGFVFIFGMVVPVHVRHSWHAKKNRKNGVFFLCAVSVLTLSGYSLYYVGEEGLRNALSNVHLWLGLAGPVLLVWHIISGQKSTGAR